MLSDAEKKEFEKLYVQERKSYDEIGAYFGIARATVFRYIKKMQLPRQIDSVQDLIGKEFGKVVVEKYVSSGRYRYLNQETGKYTNGGKYDVWQCKCKCGTIFSAKSGNLKSGHVTQCKKCVGSYLSKKFRRVPIDYNVWYRIVKRCNHTGMELDVTPEYLYDLFVAQGGRCALSGVEIWFGKTRREESTASPDRIDCSQGYVKGNIRWVHKYVNIMRNSQPDNLFVEWCKKIVDHNSSLAAGGSSLS